MIHSLDPRSGGPSHAIRELVQQQADEGDEIALVTTSVQSAEPWAEKDGFVRRLHGDPAFRGIELFVARAYGRRRPWSRFAVSPRGCSWLRHRLNDGDLRPAIVHIHGVFSFLTEIAARAAARAGIPFLIRPAGSLDPTCLVRGHAALKGVFYRFFLLGSLRRAACIQATSPMERDMIREIFPNAKTVVVPQGVALSTLGDGVTASFLAAHPRLKRRRFILCLSRIHPIKRLDLALGVFGRLATRFPELDLVIAGNDAGHLGKLESLRDRLGLRDRVHFIGFIQGRVKAGAFRSAAVFLQCSEHENFGRSVVEAMAHGLPVVATRTVSAHTYVKEAGAGLAVDADPESLAGGLEAVLNSREPYGRRGRQFVEAHLSWPSVNQRLRSAYLEMIQQGGRHDRG